MPFNVAPGSLIVRPGTIKFDTLVEVLDDAAARSAADVSAVAWLQLSVSFGNGAVGNSKDMGPVFNDEGCGRTCLDGEDDARTEDGCGWISMVKAGMVDGFST